MVVLFFFFKQKTAYELRISDWSSDVCSSDLFGLRGPLGEFLAEQLGVVFAFRWTGAALASAVMGFPLMVRTLRLSIESADRRLEQAAATPGAPPCRVFRSVPWPPAWPGALPGPARASAQARGDFGATTLFASALRAGKATISSSHPLHHPS